MINVFNIPLDVEYYKWIELYGQQVYNTEYGHVVRNRYETLPDVLKHLRFRVEWLADAKRIDFKDTLLMSVVLDELIDRGLKHHHLGIYLSMLPRV